MIPDNVTYIGYYAFYNCNKLETVIIKNSKCKIKSNAFDECNSLNNITIGNIFLFKNNNLWKIKNKN